MTHLDEADAESPSTGLLATCVSEGQTGTDKQCSH